MDVSLDIKVTEDALKKAEKCKKNYSCLSGKRIDICKVELNVENKIHFVKCMGIEPCPFRISFGYSYICVCPVRKELFNRFGI